MGLTAHTTLGQTPAQISSDFLDHLLGGYPKRDFQVRLWDGSAWGANLHPRFVLVLTHPGALREMFLSASELTLGEAFVFGDFEIEGDMEAALDLADYLLEHGDRTLAQSLHLAGMLRKLPERRPARAGRQAATLPGTPHSKERDRHAISYHYDLPPEFFGLWLDRNLQYSSAYFTRREMDLDTAQNQKLDYICRKLRLRRGDRLLDIGCGWGGLLIHAAAHYDAQAVGITLSVPQAELARQRIRDSGLNDRCRVEVCDYRDLEADQQFDRIASVGMFEHVGEARLQEYFTVAWRLLRPGGAFLNSGIAASSAWHRHRPSFIDHYVFPDGELVPLSTSLGAAEGSGFEVRDVESLREHYALTLHDWLQRLEAHAEDARRVTDETTYRTWRLYIAASERRFRSGQLNLYQVLLAKPVDGKSRMPLTRADWYCAQL
jgi:cyclopropane-fatty-acyl-phospholipid synthase